MNDVTVPANPTPGPIGDDTRAPVVLVVDDSRLQRRILSASLNRWGYHVKEAASGREALDICAGLTPDLIVSDWMMPGMNGPEFCRRLRAGQDGGYSYFILLTSKSETRAVAEGLDSGADDFLSKPFNTDELRARITAGSRLVAMQRELAEKNRLISATLTELRGLYDALDSDLAEARKLQQSLVRDTYRRIGQTDVSLLLSPSGHVGGDLVGFFWVSADQVGVYALDVSGHGVSSALMTARLAGHLSDTAPEQNLALCRERGRFAPRPLNETATALNALMLAEVETDHYFTLLLALVDLASGNLRICQAGHPHPVIERADGTMEEIGNGGLPVGLIPEAAFPVTPNRLFPGDRLIIPSDGITECGDGAGGMIGGAGLARLLRATRGKSGRARLESLLWHLKSRAGDAGFADDISAALIEFGGA